MLAMLSRISRTESIGYLPVGGRRRIIEAVVDRGAREDAGGVAVPAFEITVLNDQAAGIDPRLMDRGGDQFQVAEFPGGDRDAHRRRIMAVLEVDRDFVRLQIG
jgi:hypothetical protein